MPATASAVRSTPERNALVLQYLALVGWVLNRYRHKPYVRQQDPEDAFTIGVLGLIRAAERWQPGRGVRFNTYAVPFIRGYLQNHHGSNRLVPIGKHAAFLGIKSPQWVPTPQDRHGKDIEPVAPPERIPDADPERVANALRFLDPRSRELIHRRYWLGETLEEIGQSWGCRRENVRQLEARAMAKLEKQLAGKSR